MVRAADDAEFGMASGKGGNGTVRLGFRNKIFRNYNLVPALSS